MKASDIPYKFAEVWAKNATSSFITAPIPEFISSGTVASQDLGFPPATATPVGAGGVPPGIGDFNGVLQYCTLWSQWQQAGGPVFYDATFSGNIGGYPKGAVLTAAAFGEKMWLNTSENNTSDPDTGGAGWVSLLAGRLLNIQVFASVGTHTYTPTAGTNEVLVLVLGGGASGAGSAATGAGQTSVGAGGAAGSAGLGLITSGFAGVTITVGAGGAGVGGANANAGSASSFGTIISAPGGPQTSFEGATTGPWATGSNGGAPATGGSIWNGGGAPGGESFSLSATIGWGGQGAASILGGGGGQVPMGANGTNGTAPGSGGGGTVNYPSFGSLIGGNGAAGIVIVAELS